MLRGYTISLYNTYMDARFNLCLVCPKRDMSKCTMNEQELKDLINLRLATCPLFKWGSL